MTVFGADYSNFNNAPTYSGLSFVTHKATEGTTVVHDKYGDRLNAARAAGVPVLGSYHVVRTPGNAGNGSMAQQITYWLAYLDAHTPWWRTWPHWMMQVDAEKWPYDAVSGANVKAFAALLVASGVPAYKVTYASRGQYGDTLAGIATDLWNADYRGGPGYPGDGWVKAGNSVAGWAPFSGQTPVWLQYTSTPYDKDAFRGSLTELLTRTRSSGAPDERGDVPMFMAKTTTDPAVRLSDGFQWKALQSGPFNALKATVPLITVPDKAALDALCGVEWAPTGALSPADVTAVEVAVESAARAGARAALTGATITPAP